MNANLLKILGVFLFLPSWVYSESPKPPEIYVDENFCPGEGCQYGEWKVVKEILVYAQPRGKNIVGTLKPHEFIQALTGNVYVRPLAVEVLYPKGDFKQGETFYLLSNIGEGNIKTWQAGKIGETSYEGISGLWNHDCKDVSKKCWARVKSSATDIDAEWWVKFDGKSLKGWIKEPSSSVEGSDKFE